MDLIAELERQRSRLAAILAPYFYRRGDPLPPVGTCDNLILFTTEISDPTAPSANQAKVYIRDTGGKTELVVRFATGAIQQIAIEP